MITNLIVAVYGIQYRIEIELKMFYQTYTSRKPLKVPVTLHSHHPPAATEWSRLLLYEICSVWRTPYNALSIGMTQ